MEKWAWMHACANSLRYPGCSAARLSFCSFNVLCARTTIGPLMLHFPAVGETKKMRMAYTRQCVKHGKKWASILPTKSFFMWAI